MKTFRFVASAVLFLTLTLTTQAQENTDILANTFRWCREVLENSPQPIFITILRIGVIFAIYAIICGKMFQEGAPNSFVAPALALLASIVIGMAFPFQEINFKPTLKALLFFLSIIACLIIPYFGSRWLSDDEKYHARFRYILYGVGGALFVFQLASL